LGEISLINILWAKMGLKEEARVGKPLSRIITIFKNGGSPLYFPTVLGEIFPPNNFVEERKLLKLFFHRV